MLLPGDVVMLTVWRRDGETRMCCTACEVACEGAGATWSKAGAAMPCTHAMMEFAADGAAGPGACDGAALDEIGRELSRREGDVAYGA